MISRSDFIKIITAAAFLPKLPAAEEGILREDLAKRFREGMAKLDEIFWVSEIANWLDRPGKDLRGHFEGKINPPWWSCANGGLHEPHRHGPL
jgi:hypothetical protein